jgi:glutamate racemase
VSDPRPIGVFDSGVGGLTVVRALMDELPHEPIVYLGDSGRAPYGPRSIPEIRRFAVQIAGHLMASDVKMIVVACNAATAAALDEVAAAVPVPVIGVIEPAVRAAVVATRNRRIGMIGTLATVSTGAYERAVARADGGVRLFSQACPLFVEFVERGETTSPRVLETAERDLAPLKEAGVDTLILGCTHYPFLRAAIHHVMGDGVLLFSSAEETAVDTFEALAAYGLLADPDHERPPEHRFVSSGDPALFEALGSRFLGPEVRSVEVVSFVDSRSAAGRA